MPPYKNICFLNGLEGLDQIVIRSSAKADHLLITMGNRRAVEYKISDKTVVNNFFLPSHMFLSTPVVMSGSKQEFVCAINKTQLLVWDGQESRLEEVKNVIKLPSPVNDLILEEGKNAILAFDNGDLQSVDYVCQNQEKYNFNKCQYCPRVIVKSRIMSHDGIKHCIHIGADSACLHRMTLDSTRYDQIHVKTFQITNGANIELAGKRLVYTIKNEAIIYTKDIFNSHSSSSDVVHDINFKPLEVSSISAISSLNPNYVAFICKGSDDQDDNFIKILNINYGTVVAEIPMKLSSSNQLICVDGDKIMFKQGSRIACWTVENLPQGLSDLIGCNLDRQSSDVGAELPNGDIPVHLFSYDNSTSYDLIQEVIKAEEISNVELIDEHLPDLVKIALIENALADLNNHRLLRTALLIPITDQVVLERVKNLSFTSAKKLIYELVKIMQEIQDNPDEFEHYITWLTLILDAHYTNFMVSKDTEAKDVINECSRLLNELDSSVNMLATVMTRMKMMNRENQLNHVHAANRLFSVEVVYF